MTTILTIHSVSPNPQSGQDPAQNIQNSGQVHRSQGQVSCSDPNVSNSWIRTLFDQMKHLTGMVHVVQERMHHIEGFDIKNLTSIDNKLTSLEATLKETTLQVDRLDACIRNTSGKCDELVKENYNLKQRLRDIENHSGEERDRLSRDIEDAYYDIDSIYVEQRDMREAILGIKVRSMRDNLVFHGIPEMPGEEPREVVQNFVKKNLKCDIDVQLVRAHRTGPRQYNRPRTLVAQFANSDERGQVLTSTRTLRDTKYGISEQFPPEIVSRHKELLPPFKEARRRRCKASLTVDKLHIDGKRCYAGDDPFGDSRPTNRDTYANALRHTQPNKIRKVNENDAQQD